jgi:hypothetical protein
MGTNDDVCRICNWRLLSGTSDRMDMIHNKHCPVINRTALGGHSDAAKRVCDTYNLHRLASPYGTIGYWIACTLSDGSSDNVLYDSKQDAIRHQKHNENYYTFTQIVPSSMTECEAEVMLKTARMIYDMGGRMSDGYSRHELIKRLGWEDQNPLSDGIVTNLTYGRTLN